MYIGILLGLLLVFWIGSIFNKSKSAKRTSRNKNRRKKNGSANYPNYLPLKYDEGAILWCSNFLGIDKASLKKILNRINHQYNNYYIGKRSGGLRRISAPNEQLLAIQKIIYQRILLSVPIHAAAMGFRKKTSITDNARLHLGNKEVLKTDIKDFFGSIKQSQVIKAFETIGYPEEIAKVFSGLCCLKKRLPQGAPTSPALSNIIAYRMDTQLATLCIEHGYTYSRYADDMIFSGNHIYQKDVLMEIKNIVQGEGFTFKDSKTHFMTEKKRKIITGISVSSGQKLTIPRAKKREMRKNIHFILTRGLEGHKNHIGSKDPAYLKRMLGYLHFWLSVEPDNQYVKKSIQALKRINR